MNFKKYGIVYLLIFLVFVALGLNLLPGSYKSKLLFRNHPVASSSPLASTMGVTVEINDGNKVSAFQNIKASNAYEALIAGAKLANLKIQTKQYDFGVFIEQIGELKNTKDKAWIYYVNGKPGDVAADKKNVSSGDKVEWKYEKPSF